MRFYCVAIFIISRTIENRNSNIYSDKGYYWIEKVEWKFQTKSVLRKIIPKHVSSNKRSRSLKKEEKKRKYWKELNTILVQKYYNDSNIYNKKLEIKEIYW